MRGSHRTGWGLVWGGAELGLTRERVRQIETEALRRLADGLTDPRDRNY